MDKTMMKIKKLLSVKPPEYLYHYTDMNSLKGIISNNEMWATHIRFMNDYEEQQLALKLLKERVPNLLKNKKIDCEKLLDYLDFDVKKETLKRDIYIISFSEEKDSLGQWRGYGNRIPSFCAGLSTISFLKYFVSEPNSPIIKNKEMFKTSDILNESNSIDDSIFNFNDSNELNRKIFFVRCIYDELEQMEYIDELVLDALEKIELQKTKINVKNLSEEIAKRFVVYCSFIKDAHFREEKEWRVVIIYEKTRLKKDIDKLISSVNEKLKDASNEQEEGKLENDLDNLNNMKGKMKYDAKVLSYKKSKYGDKPFIKFKFPSKCFKQFIIGSCPDKTIVEDWLLKFLINNGFEIEKKNELVVHSEIPYRSWI
ncbi:MAG: DUF2971 domain-containing protein [Treponema sp.]|nr:DUF2971 domain-containing protein [Treponema sp.]MDY4130038.1 DUF2971 domain-containing protein [Treponema sp.]MDY5837171.1 DUF2971 domain-containing protein [Treponema sp.]